MQILTHYRLPFVSPVFLLLLAFAVGLLVFLFYDAFIWVFDQWSNQEEYSHGMMIPFVAGYLAWQRKDKLVHDTDSGSAWGLLLMLLALVLYVISDLATIYVAVLLSFLLCFYGLVLLTLGWRNTRELLPPLLILVFMVPLPAFINNNLSSSLQLISSELGVAFIRLFDITVFLEGNVIDLGTYKLQVVDACSGLRYLYPLVALGFILAYLCQIPLWMRALIFVSTIPITVIMNSIRIGAIGVSVEYWGPDMAEGLLHDIEGWFMFMASLAVLLIELFILLRLSGDKRSIGEILTIGDTRESATDQSSETQLRYKTVPILIFILAVISITMTSLYSLLQSDRPETIPDRLALNHFPLLVGDWYGTPDSLESIYIDALKFDDYIIADYLKGDDHINLYIAYYGSQKKGESAHSPRSCIPGGGWLIESIETVQIGDLYLNSKPLMANRTLIRKGDARQVVYYWFQQRGRNLTNEYLVKWYIFRDALMENRTDGALVRLTLPLKPSDSLQDADNAVADFMSAIQFRMNDFIPN